MSHWNAASSSVVVSSTKLYLMLVLFGDAVTKAMLLIPSEAIMVVRSSAVDVAVNAIMGVILGRRARNSESLPYDSLNAFSFPLSSAWPL